MKARARVHGGWRLTTAAAWKSAQRTVSLEGEKSAMSARGQRSGGQC
jgi:hypothetical protein